MPQSSRPPDLDANGRPVEVLRHDARQAVGRDEPTFRQWYGDWATRYSMNPDPDDPEQHYDYRAAFRAGVKPPNVAKGEHWPSFGKDEGHPNRIVGGFDTVTGERKPGTPRASEQELVALGWDPAAAKRLAAMPEEIIDELSDLESQVVRQTFRDTTPKPGAIPPPSLTSPEPASQKPPDLDAQGRPIARGQAAQPNRTWTDTATDAFGGVRAGLATTVFGGGDLIRRGLGMERVINQPDVQAAMTAPDSTAGKVGKAAEQIGEFFIPTGLVGKAGKVAEVVKSGLLTTAQTGSPTAGGASAVITAALPVAAKGAIRAGGALKASALETMANSLKATKEWAKADAERLAPEMLRRGIGGSIPALRKQSSEMAAKVGKNLQQAYTDATAAGQTVPAHIVRGNVQLASDGLHMMSPAGKRLPIPGYESAIKGLDQLDEFVKQLGPDIPVDKAATLKRAFDDIAEQAGLFGPGKMASASEKKQAWAFKQASDSFRHLLNTNPTIEALNKEASFWIGLRDVVAATKLRKVGQTGGLIAAGAGGVGASIGAMQGDSASEAALKGLAGAVAGRQLVRVLQSPAFMNKVSAPLKNELAEALASANQGRIASVMSRISAALPAQLSPSVVR